MKNSGLVARSLRELREAAGMTQMQLAIAVGTTPNYVSRLERGGALPSGLLLQRLAQALGVDANIIALENRGAA
jgi:transcriptional regulator with XRE-family HTH domain